MNNIKHAREKAGVKQSELAKQVGVSVVTMSRWETGTRVPNGEYLVKLATALGVTTDYLMGREEIKKDAPDGPKTAESVKEKPKTRRIERDLIAIPVVSREWTACCGNGIPALDITSTDGEVIFIPRSALRVYDDMRPPFAMHCEGDCLESDGIYDGDLIIINPAEQPANGAAALVSISGSFSLKHLFFMRNGDIILKSDDGERRLTPEQQEDDEFSVCGVLVGTYSGRPKPWTL